MSGEEPMDKIRNPYRLLLSPSPIMRDTEYESRYIYIMLVFCSCISFYLPVELILYASFIHWSYNKFLQIFVSLQTGLIYFFF